MVNMTVLRLFILAVILVTSSQMYLITRYVLWPRLQRITHCPWCWQQAGIEGEFPAPWSSTICPYHRKSMLARRQSSKRRLTRPMPAASPTKPAVEMPQPQVEEVLV